MLIHFMETGRAEIYGEELMLKFGEEFPQAPDWNSYIGLLRRTVAMRPDRVKYDLDLWTRVRQARPIKFAFTDLHGGVPQ